MAKIEYDIFELLSNSVHNYVSDIETTIKTHIHNWFNAVLANKGARTDVSDTLYDQPFTGKACRSSSLLNYGMTLKSYLVKWKLLLNITISVLISSYARVLWKESHE